jgi:anion-transporting  ArsA/GET3 family ATPase
VTDLLDRRLLFVTGKGGVGKSTVTAALALLAAEQGKRVLLVEVDAKGNLTNLFEHPPVGFDPVAVAPGVFAMQLTTEASLREYLKLNLRIPMVGRIGPIAGIFVVVVDAAATGHVIAQLDAPRTIRDLVQTGPIRNQTEWMMAILSDPAITALNVVTAPEEMPVNETIELVARARAETDVPLGAVVVNRVLPEPFTVADEPVFAAMADGPALDRLRQEAGPAVDTVLDAAALAVALRRARVPHLDALRAGVDLPLLYVPYLFVRDHGLRATRMVADALGAELGL